MALAKYGDSVVDIEGKFGGVIFRRDRCGNHIQAMGYGPHQATPKQNKRRRWFSRLTRMFLSEHGTEKNVKLWWIYSYNRPRTNKKGEVYYLNPLMAYISYNLIRVMNDLDPVATPPPD